MEKSSLKFVELLKRWRLVLGEGEGDFFSCIVARFIPVLQSSCLCFLSRSHHYFLCIAGREGRERGGGGSYR